MLFRSGGTATTLLERPGAIQARAQSFAGSVKTFAIEGWAGAPSAHPCDSMSGFANTTIVQNLQRGVGLQQAGRLDEAEAAYRDVLKIAPNNFDALNLLGMVNAQRGNMAAAAEFFQNAAKANDKVAAVWTNLGVTLRATGRAREAVDAYDRALNLDANDAGTYYNKANALKDLQRLEEAIQCFGRAVALNPRHVNAFYNRGIAFQTLGQSREAVADFDAATRLEPRFVDAHYNRGIALRDLRRLPDAVVSYERAIALKPDHVDAFINRGNALKDMGRQDDALASYNRAIQLSGGSAALLQNRGILLRDMKRYEEARDSFADALRREPDHGDTLGQQFLLAGEMCDWVTRETAREKLVALAQADKPLPPFAILIAADDQALQSRVARAFSQTHYPSQARRPPLPEGDKIKVAYISADYRTHPTAFLMADLLATHDRSRFEIHALSLVASDNSSTRTRMEKAVDKFHDAAATSDADAAAIIARENISIAVDLGGYTQFARPGILTRRPAPIAVNFLGFPGTFGAPHVDYILADRHAVPAENARHFSEKIVYLPDAYQPIDATRAFTDPLPTRSDFGLAEDAFVFCCFNNNFKMTLPLFDVWMRLLNAHPKAALWLFASNDLARANLAREAEARGIAADRLVFGGHVPHDQHLARLRLADVFLDTLPYNAHTTASDALWAGVPLVTCRGQAFPGRVAASLVEAAGLPELITGSLEEYESLAGRLAANPDLAAALKAKLASVRTTAPLFDGPRYRKAVEWAYSAMVERARAGQPPDSIVVPGAL